MEVDTAAGVSCPSGEQTLRALRELLPDWQFIPGPQSEIVPAIRLSPAGAHSLLVTLAAPGRAPEEREVPVDAAECGAAAQTIALVAKVWLRRLPPAPPPRTTAPSHPRERPHPETGGIPPPVLAPPAPTAADATLVDAGAPLVAEEDAGSRAALEADAGSAPPASASTPADAGATADSELRLDPALIAGPPEDDAGAEASPGWLHLEVGVGGAVAEGIDQPTSAASGAVVAALALREIAGLETRASLDTTLSTPSNGGNEITLDRSCYSFGAWVSVVHATPGSSLRVGASLLLDLLQASGTVTTATAYAVPTSHSAVVGRGLGVTVVWSQPIVGDLRFWGGPEMRLWSRVMQFNDSYQVQDTGSGLITTVTNAHLTLAQLWLGVSAGVAWRFF